MVMQLDNLCVHTYCIRPKRTNTNQCSQEKSCFRFCLSVCLSVKWVINNWSDRNFARNTRFSTSNQWQKRLWRKLWQRIDPHHEYNIVRKKLSIWLPFSELKISLLYSWWTFRLQINELCTPYKMLPILEICVSFVTGENKRSMRPAPCDYALVLLIFNESFR